MENRNFEEWIENFEDSIASWRYYTDFNKVFQNVNSIKNELNLLHFLSLRSPERRELPLPRSSVRRKWK